MMLLKRLNVINNIKTTDTTDLILKTDYNANINEIQNKITTDHDHDKYITTQE